MIFSRMTSKAQTTIPRAVRAALGLHEGDRVGMLDAARLNAVKKAIASHLGIK